MLEFGTAESNVSQTSPEVELLAGERFYMSEPEESSSEAVKSTEPRSAASVCSGLRPLQLQLGPDVVAHLRKWYTEEKLSAILRALATPPRQTTIRVNTIKTSREKLLLKLEEWNIKVRGTFAGCASGRLS